MRIEDEYQDVLQNIEFAVANVYRQHPEMTDYAVLTVYETLTGQYSAELNGRNAKSATLSAIEAKLLQAVTDMCEWRMGRAIPPGGVDRDTACTALDVATMILCLKRLVKSVQKWNKQGGRQGYLDFMSPYVL
jgi:hypothetical protein